MTKEQADEQAKPIWNIFADFAYAQVIKQQRRFRLIKVSNIATYGEQLQNMLPG